MGVSFAIFKKSFSLFFAKDIFKQPTIRIRCFFAILLILADVAIATLLPYCSKNIVDSLSMDVMESVSLLVVLLGIFWSLEKILPHIQDIFFFPVINQVIRNLHYRVVEHIHQISLTDYQKLSIPDIINSTRRIGLSARSFIKILFLMIIPTLFKLMVAITITLKIGLWGFLLLPTLILATFILYQGTQFYTKAREKAWQATDTSIMRINDSIINTKLARFYPEFEMKNVANLLDIEAKLWHQTNTRLHSVHIGIGLLLGITMTGILVSTTLAIQNKTLSIGDFILIKGQLIAAFLPLKTLSFEFRQLVESLVDIKKVIQILDIPKQKARLSNSDAPDQRKSISLKNVSFSYQEKQAIFNNVSLSIRQGEKIAIIGESGGGKSSLLSLIAGLHPPPAGNNSCPWPKY